jgi:hypothetical protein
MGGDNRFANYLCRLVMGTDQVRIVAAVKPARVQGAENAARPEAIAVG